MLIAFGRDDAAEQAAERLTERLMAEGFACYRVEFPKHIDANAYATKMPPATKSLGVLIRKALWLGEGKAPALLSAPVDELEAVLTTPIDEPPTPTLDPDIDLSFVPHRPMRADSPPEEDVELLPEPPVSPLPAGTG